MDDQQDKVEENDLALVEADPEKVIPLEAARAHLRHWWREPVTGVIAVAIGTYDSWFYGHDKGLSSSLDEILVIGGIVLMAGSRRLFAGPPTLLERKPNPTSTTVVEKQ